jgi:hypothetical protein
MHAELRALVERAAVRLLADEPIQPGRSSARAFEPLGRAGEVAAPQVAGAARRARAAFVRPMPSAAPRTARTARTAAT